jgi:GAF domain-containing protein
LFPEALFAEIEPAIQTDLPFEPPPPVTIVLRQEDAAFVRPELSLNVLPRTNRSWEDLRVLMTAASSMLNARGVEDVEQRALELTLSAFPAGVAVIRRSQKGVTSASASAREGHARQLTAMAQDLVKRAASEQVSLLYLGDTTVVAAPLIAHGEVLGAVVLEAAGPGPRLDKHHLQLLTGIAALIAPALGTQLQLRG